MIGATRRRQPRADAPAPAAAGRSMLLPSIGAHVTVDCGGHTLRCLVEAVGGDELQLALPGGGLLIDDGACVTVEWPNGRGVTAMKALAETIALGKWLVRPVEGIESVQRRAYVRIYAPVRMQMTLADGAVLHLRAANLSEGGASVVVPADVKSPPSVGERVRVSVLCGMQPVRMAAEVLRTRDVEDGRDLALRFVGSYPADELRRWVLDRQVAQRRRRRLA